MELIIAPLIGALLYRLRGGLFSNLMRSLHAKTGSRVALWLSKQRTQIMRLIWAAPTAVAVCVALSLPFLQSLHIGALHITVPSWQLAALTVSFFSSMALIGNGDYLDPKREQPLIDMTGILRNLIAIAPVAYFEPLPAAIYVATGAMHAQLYRISHERTNASELAEMLVGALCWFSIVVIAHAGL